MRQRSVAQGLPPDAGSPADAAELVELIRHFVAGDSEGGRRAQGAAAGVLDAGSGPALVHSRRINDPDRDLPGDIGVRAGPDDERWLMVIEVRDKPVTVGDIGFALQKAMEAEVPRVAVLAALHSQEALDIAAHVRRAARQGDASGSPSDCSRG